MRPIYFAMLDHEGKPSSLCGRTWESLAAARDHHNQYGIALRDGHTSVRIFCLSEGELRLVAKGAYPQRKIIWDLM